MPDVGSSRLKAYKQRHLPEDQQDYDLDEMAGGDLTAYVCVDDNRLIGVISLFVFSIRNFRSL